MEWFMQIHSNVGQLQLQRQPKVAGAFGDLSEIAFM
jgi:hypothetical protein